MHCTCLCPESHIRQCLFMSTTTILERATTTSLLGCSNGLQSRRLALTLGSLFQSFTIPQSLPIFTISLKIKTEIFSMTYEPLNAFYHITFVQSDVSSSCLDNSYSSNGGLLTSLFQGGASCSSFDLDQTPLLYTLMELHSIGFLAFFLVYISFNMIA